jgi:predicted O-linked N-acetylglucosamine transferase (SPINDLY family)
MTSIADRTAQGWQCYQAGDLGQAEHIFRDVLSDDPENSTVLYLLGTACQVQGKLHEAIANYERALQFKPDYPEVHNNLGVAHAIQGRWSDAIASYLKARSCQPNHPDAYINLGVALTEVRRLDEAVAVLQQAVRLRPDSAGGHYNLANALQHREDFAESVRSYKRALVFRPDHADACNNMAKIFLVEGRTQEAISAYRRAIASEPNSIASHSNLLFALNYDPRLTAAELASEHRRWADVHARVSPLGPEPDHSRDPNRRLRIGYLSPDFYNHPAVSFLEPILTHHDPRQVQTTCYAEVLRPDAVTARIRSLAHDWRSTRGLTDLQVAEQIRADSVDILVDLAGHAADSRVRVLAYKPAPIQITYLGYPNTTGLTAVDYLLTDAVVDPPNEPSSYAEEPVRLQGGFCCYTPPGDAPQVAPLPAESAGHVTFGSLQNLAKLNMEVIALWCRLLRAVPTARLLIFRTTLSDKAKRFLRGEFRLRGIEEGRVELARAMNTGTGSHLEVYSAVDISLDTVPWNGHTTTCESLWMGVPMITLYGSRHAGRMAASVLTQLELSELIAHTPEEFIEIGARLAGNIEELARQRRDLRARMRLSPLCDGATFSRTLEDTYRRLWRQWCAAPAS